MSMGEELSKKFRMRSSQNESVYPHSKNGIASPIISSSKSDIADSSHAAIGEIRLVTGGEVRRRNLTHIIREPPLHVKRKLGKSTRAP